MAKKKVAVKKDDLPEQVEYITVKLPVYVGEYSRPMMHIVQGRLVDACESNALQRVKYAYYLIDKQNGGRPHNPVTMSSALRLIASAISKAF